MMGQEFSARALILTHALSPILRSSGLLPLSVRTCTSRHASVTKARVGWSWITLFLTILLVAQVGAESTQLAPNCIGYPPISCEQEEFAIEFRHKETGVYFITNCKKDREELDKHPQYFERTGIILPMGSIDGMEFPRLRRYFIKPNGLVARHFHTNLTEEITEVDKQSRDPGSRFETFCYEGEAGRARAPKERTVSERTVFGDFQEIKLFHCELREMPIWRLFNDPKDKSDVKPQHRWLASWKELQETLARNDNGSDTKFNNWKEEDVKMCVASPEAVLIMSEPRIEQASGLHQITLRARVADGVNNVEPKFSIWLSSGLALQSPSTCQQIGNQPNRYRCSLPVASAGQEVSLPLSLSSTGPGPWSIRALVSDGRIKVDSNSAPSLKQRIEAQEEAEQCVRTGVPHVGCAQVKLTQPATAAPTQLSITNISPASPYSVNTSGTMPTLSFTVSRTGSAPSAEAQCKVVSPTGAWSGSYSCTSSGSVVSGTSQSCQCTTSSSAPSTATSFNLSLSAEIPGSSAATASSSLVINVVSPTPPPSASAWKVNWVSASVTRNASNGLEFTGRIKNEGTDAVGINLFVRRASGAQVTSSGIDNPYSLSAGEERDIKLTVNATDAAALTGETVYLCVVRPGFPFSGILDGTCPSGTEGLASQAYTGSSGSRSAPLTVPPAGSLNDWQARAGQAQGSSDILSLNSPLSFTLPPSVGEKSPTLRFRCEQVSPAGQNNPAPCLIEVKLADESTFRLVTATAENFAQSHVNQDLYIEVADASGRIQLCAGNRSNTTCSLMNVGGQTGPLPIVELRVRVNTSDANSSNNTATIRVQRPVPDWKASLVKQSDGQTFTGPLDLRDLEPLGSGAASLSEELAARCQGPATPAKTCRLVLHLEGNTRVEKALTFVEGDSEPTPAQNRFYLKLLPNGDVQICGGDRPLDGSCGQDFINGSSSPVSRQLNRIEVRIDDANDDANPANNLQELSVQRPLPDWVAEIVQLSGTSPESASLVQGIIDLSMLSESNPTSATYAFRCRQIAPRGVTNYEHRTCQASLKDGDNTIERSGLLMGADTNGVPDAANRFYFSRGSSPGLVKFCSNATCEPTERAISEITVRIEAASNAPVDSQAMNNSMSRTVVRASNSARGCEDDESVPVIHTINSGVPAPTPVSRFLDMSTFGAAPSIHPHTVAIEILVPRDAPAATRSIEFTPYSGFTNNDVVISRCRGSFVDSGLVAKQGVNGYPSEASVPIPTWDIGVDYGVNSPHRARLYREGEMDPGRTLPPPYNNPLSGPWQSDGRYYINIRQTVCSTSNGICRKRYTL